MRGPQVPIILKPRAVAAAAAVKIRLTSLGANLVESGDATNGWNYLGNSSAGFGFGEAQKSGTNATVKLASGVDGYIRAVVTSSAIQENSFKLGFFTSTSDVDFPAGFQIGVDSSFNYAMGNAFNYGGVNGSTVAVANGHWIQLRRVCGTTNIFAEVSTNSGGSWTIVHTFSSASTADLYVIMWGSNASGGLSNLTSDRMA